MTPDPAASDSETATDGGPPADIGEQDRQTGRPKQVAPADDIDWRGWLLVAVVFVSFLVIPGMVLYIPEAQGFINSLGLSTRRVYVALPMVPAIILGVTAVWASLRTQGR